MSIQQAVQHFAQQQAQHRRWVSYAKVKQVDHKRNRATVELMPHGNICRMLRIANVYVGDGWTFHFPLMKDDECIVEFPNGQLASGIITWRLHNDLDRWPNREEFKGTNTSSSSSRQSQTSEEDKKIRNQKPIEDLRKCGYKDVFLLHKSGSFLRFFGEKAKKPFGESIDGQYKNNDDGDILLRARGKGCIRIMADTRLELVAPEIRVRGPHDHQSPFVLSEWVDYWNGWVDRYNAHTHLFSSGPGIDGPPSSKERYLTKPEVCDMHTLGVVGWGNGNYGPGHFDLR